MGNKQAMIDFVRAWCADDSHGYDQANRWGPDCDCSSLMYMAARAGGYAVPTSGTRYTGTMRRHFAEAEFRVLPFDGNLYDCPVGTIILNERDHTEMFVDRGRFGGARINGKGQTTGGRPGDQTGNEVSECPAYLYGSGWDYVLIPPNDDGENVPQPDEGVIGSGVVYEVHTSDGWLGTVSKADDTEDGYAGWQDKPIDGVRAYRQDGKPLTLQCYMSNGVLLGPTEFRGSLWGSNESGDSYAGDIDSRNYIIGITCDGAHIRVACFGKQWFGWLIEGQTPEGDDFAGDDLPLEKAITAIQMKI